MNSEALTINSNVNSRFLQRLERYAPAFISAKAKLYYFRYRSRRQLLNLDDSRLDDIGLSRKAVLKEASLPFWR